MILSFERKCHNNFIFATIFKAGSSSDTCTVSQGIQPFFRLDLTTAVTFWGVELLSSRHDSHGNFSLSSICDKAVFTTRRRSCGKVMFSVMSVCLFRRGSCTGPQPPPRTRSGLSLPPTFSNLINLDLTLHRTPPGSIQIC